MGSENSGWHGPDNGGTHVGKDQVAVKTEIGVMVFNKPGVQKESSVNVAEVMRHVRESKK